MLTSLPRAGWLYYRFTLSLREVEDLLAERDQGLFEIIRQWCDKFGPQVARNLKQRRPLPATHV